MQNQPPNQSKTNPPNQSKTNSKQIYSKFKWKPRFSLEIQVKTMVFTWNSSENHESYSLNPKPRTPEALNP